MKHSVWVPLFLAVPFLPQVGSALSDAAASRAGDADVALGEFADFVPAGPSIPDEMLDLMRISQLRYQEGTTYLKSGDPEMARGAYELAVDMILKSEWAASGHPALDKYFRELLDRIRRDESRYVKPAEESAEQSTEAAVVDELDKVDLIPITIDPLLQHEVEADLASTSYDIPIMVNDLVLKSLKYWLGGGAKYFSDGLIRSGRYREMMLRIFREESIPQDILYLAQVESLFKTKAFSRRKAKGIWQFGQATAVRYGLRVDRYVDERSDPEKSTRAAARYLNDLFAKFGDWNLVLAAYNWGEGKVRKLVKRSGLKDFWDLLELQRNFPRETKAHVQLIHASIILAKNPEKYGLPTELDPPVSFDRVTVSRPVDLRAAARLLNVPVAELRELNPELRGYATPPRRPDYELKVPVGYGEILSEKLASLPPARLARPAPPPPAGGYRVRPGDTLSRIAARFKVSVAALQQANGIKSPKLLRAGRVLRIPGERGDDSASASKPGSTTQVALR